jgi:DNA-directed RNA polymerase-3 subunit RPC5
MSPVVVKSEAMDVDVDMEDDDEDELVREIDVYVSPELSQQIYLVQFPLQHSAPMAESARIKKKHGMLELEHKIPVNNIGSEGSFFLSSRKQVSHVIPISTHMALGKILEDGAMHLLPLNHIQQMRPDFGHVDEVDQQNISDEDHRKDQDQSDKKPVLFQKKESERAAILRKSSYSYKRACEDGEEWQELNICTQDSAEYRASTNKIMSQNKSRSIMSEDCKNFVKSLDYLPARPELFVDEDLQEGVSHLVNVVKRLTGMLHRGVPVTYSVIRPQFPPTVDDVDLLMSLASCAVLVRGNFYLQSRLLLWDNQMANARNFILCVLNTFGHCQRRGLEVVFKGTTVSSEWIYTILNQVAIPGKEGWMPRLADNIEFCLQHAEQMMLHNQYWERQAAKFAPKLELYQANIQE